MTIPKQHLANSTPFRLGAVLVGGLFAFLGAVALASVLGYLPSKVPSSFTYRVFGSMASSVFILAGLGMLLFGLGWAQVAARLGGVALLCFVLTFNWIAFGPGERQFTRKTSSSLTGTHSSPASEWEGRIAFGVFAVLMDAVIVYGLVAGRRKKP